MPRFLKIRSLFILLILTATSFAAPLHRDQADLPEQRTGFVENKGQFTDMQGRLVPFVLYKMQSPEMDVYITETGITYLLKENKPTSKDRSARWERIDMNLSGASI